MTRTKDLLTSDLAAWRMAGKGGFRPVSDSVIESHGIESYGGSGILWYADETFADFDLAVEWRIQQPTDNSGVFLRSPPLADSLKPAIEQGYEVQIDDRGFDPQKNILGSSLHLTGAIYRLAPAAKLCSRPVGDWNRFEITARGPLIAVVLNGTEVSRLENANRSAHGHVGLQAHHEGSAVQFRALRVTPL